MAQIGNFVIYIIMACAVAGAVASIFNQEKGLGKEFLEGIYSIGPIFVPVAGIMAANPYLSKIIEAAFGPLFAGVGADPAIAATTIIAVDMGGYQLAKDLAATPESWIMAMMVGYMAGATIVFSIPVGLSMLEREDHPYLALGAMAGLLSIPIGVLVSSLLISGFEPLVRGEISTNTEATTTLALSASTIFANLVPLIAVCVVLALGLRLFPDRMIAGFLWFGWLLTAALRLILVFSIVEYFTGVFTTVFGAWGFEPIIADEKDQFRALEIAGYIGIMLAGAFPMVYLINKYLAGPMEAFGRRIGVDAKGAAGLLAAAANVLAMFHLIKGMAPKEKVLCIAFAVCGAFMFGDHLAFTANFQPNLIPVVMAGKLVGGISGFLLAYWLSVPRAISLEQRPLQEQRVLQEQSL